MNQYSQAENPVIQNIIRLHPVSIPFAAAASFLNQKPDAAYKARSLGRFPLRVRDIGGRLIVFTSDLIRPR